jgi:hypothetical protein
MALMNILPIWIAQAGRELIKGLAGDVVPLSQAHHTEPPT